MGKSHPWFDNIWTVQHIRNGKVIWEANKKNTITNAGERSILNSYFKNIEAPSQFYIRLASGYIGISDTLVTVKGEPSGSGYAPILIERSIVGFPKLELVEGDYRLVSKTVQFSSTGSWNPVNYIFLATTSDSSGVLVAALNLSTERALVAGDILQVNFKIRLR
jgi:hypothetical protein